MIRYAFICLTFTLLGSFGGYCFKKAASESTSIIKIPLNPYLYVGGLFYVAGAVLNILLLKELNYTIVLPLTSITYIWTIIISYFLLKEKITLKKFIGIGLIILGAVLLAAV